MRHRRPHPVRGLRGLQSLHCPATTLHRIVSLSMRMHRCIVIPVANTRPERVGGLELHSSAQTHRAPPPQITLDTFLHSAPPRAASHEVSPRPLSPFSITPRPHAAILHRPPQSHSRRNPATTASILLPCPPLHTLHCSAFPSSLSARHGSDATQP